MLRRWWQRRRYRQHLDASRCEDIPVIDAVLGDRRCCEYAVAGMLHQEHVRRQIRLRIASRGGVVLHALAIIDSLRSSTVPISIHLHHAGGAAALIVAAASRIAHISAEPDATIGFTPITARRSDDQAALSRLRRECIDILGMDREDARANAELWMDRAVQLDLSAARYWGLVHEIRDGS